MSDRANLGKNVSIGVGVVIEEDVSIGDGTEIGNYVVIKSGTRIGKNCIIGDFSLLGKKPALSPMSTAIGKINLLEIGDNVKINSFAILFAGSKIDDGCVIGDRATIRERVTIGRESVIGLNVCIENDTSIGSRCRIQTNAYITAYTIVEDYVFIAPCVTTTNDNYMGRTKKSVEMMKGPVIRKGARIGGNAILLPGVVIEKEAFVAAGSVVTKDVPEKSVVKGVPARPFKEVPEEELLIYQNYYEEEES
ncbi:MAG: acetyltransferase [Actinobacteria bacterium]|nr:acetyltransferase [Actinomycetota bacterium]